MQRKNSIITYSYSILLAIFVSACATTQPQQINEALQFRQAIRSLGPMPSNTMDNHVDAAQTCQKWSSQELQWAISYAEPDTQSALLSESALCWLLANQGVTPTSQIAQLSLTALQQYQRHEELRELALAIGAGLGKKHRRSLLTLLAQDPEYFATQARELLQKYPQIAKGFSVDRPLAIRDDLPSSDDIVLALPFYGKAQRVYWRMAEDFVLGAASVDNERRIRFVDASRAAERPLSNLLTAKPALWVGPFKRDEAHPIGNELRTLEIPSLGFYPQSLTSGPEFRLVQSLDRTVSKLIDILIKAGVSSLAVIAAADETGDDQVRAFMQHARARKITITGVQWYRPDLSDLSSIAGRLYGLHRYTPRQMKDLELEPQEIDGVVQADVTLAFGAPDDLARVLSELKYNGSNFQVFASDYNAQHPKVVKEIRKAPVVFIDHFVAADDNPHLSQTAIETLRKFEEDVGMATAGQPLIIDLIMYEAGQLAVSDYAGATSAVVAGGTAYRDQGVWSLPQYPMQANNRKVRPLDTEWLTTVIASQRNQYNEFQKLKAEKAQKEAEEAEAKLQAEESEATDELEEGEEE